MKKHEKKVSLILMILCSLFFMLESVSCSVNVEHKSKSHPEQNNPDDETGDSEDKDNSGEDTDDDENPSDNDDEDTGDGDNTGTGGNTGSDGEGSSGDDGNESGGTDNNPPTGGDDNPSDNDGEDPGDGDNTGTDDTPPSSNATISLSLPTVENVATPTITGSFNDATKKISLSTGAAGTLKWTLIKGFSSTSCGTTKSIEINAANLEKGTYTIVLEVDNSGTKSSNTGTIEIK